jgi:hypothetical protein
VLLAGTLPFTTSEGDTTNGTPLHVTFVIAVINGRGFTVTVNVNALLGHVGVVSGVTVYVAVCTKLELFVSVP